MYQTSRAPVWQRLEASGVFEAQHLSVAAAPVRGINPADLAGQINTIQVQPIESTKAKIQTRAAARHVRPGGVFPLNEPNQF